MIVGAYPSAPESAQLDGAAFDAFHERIALVTGCTGFEIPFGSALVPDETATMRMLGRGGAHVLTLLPAVLELGIGLADPDEDRRAAAIALTERACSAAARANGLAGRPVIGAVLIHSAPRVTRASAHAARAAFATSLADVAQWRPAGVRIVVEHCDSFEGPVPVKGFLDLASELELAARHGFGTAINWGRSYLETRRLDGPLEHAGRARSSGTLSVLSVSSATDAATRLGPAFSDNHAPVRTERTAEAGFGASLLDPDVLAGFLRAGRGLSVITKVAGGESEVADSVEAVRRALVPTPDDAARDRVTAS